MSRTRTVVGSVVLSVVAAVGLVGSPGAAQAAYPGGDGRIAFVRANQIYTMTATGTGVTQLTTDGKNYRPEWSPNGQRISYIHETATGAKDVWVMGAAGGNKQRVTTTGDVSSAGASWSPNGAQLALARTVDFGSTLFTVRSTKPFGTPTQRLASNDTCAAGQGESITVRQYLAWSPGGQIGFKGSGEACSPDDSLSIFTPATGAVQVLSITGGECCGFYLWSDVFFGPTGTFGWSEANRGPEFENPNAPTRVIYPGFASVDKDTGGAPSPSGTYVLVTNSSRIIRANANGSARRVLTTGYQADWQPLP